MSSNHFFVYGTLLRDSLVQRLIGRIPKSLSARLQDYHRFKVNGASYPGIYPTEGALVEVKVPQFC